MITFGETEVIRFHVSTGEPSWIRTSDLLIKSQLLYRLSYGPTLKGRLPSWAPAGKAVSEMADRIAADAPSGSDRGERLQHEGSASELGMRDRQSTRAELATAPQRDVEIEDAWAPAAAPPAPELTLERLEARQQGGRMELAFDQRHRIGEITASAAMCCIEDDRRRIEQPELFVQAGNCSFHDPRRPPEAAMRPV